LAELSSPKNPFDHLLEACYEVILLWRSHRKLHCVKSYRVKYLLPARQHKRMRFHQPETFIDVQRDDEARSTFQTHGWSDFWIKWCAVSLFQNFGKN